MGDINVPDALKQMGGIFGYKVVKIKSSNGDFDFAVKKKDIFDRIFDIVFDLENHPQSRLETIAAFNKISQQVDGADNGEFKELIEKYASSSEPIDYGKIREVLKAALKYHPPRVYSRAASVDNMSEAGTAAPRIDFTKMYLQTIKKSVCNEEMEVEIFREGVFGEVSGANLASLVFAIAEHERQSEKSVTIVEPDYRVAIRLELMELHMNEYYGEKKSPESILYEQKLRYSLELMDKHPTLRAKEIKSIANESFKQSEEELAKRIPSGPQ